MGKAKICSVVCILIVHNEGKFIWLDIKKRKLAF